MIVIIRYIISSLVLETKTKNIIEIENEVEMETVWYSMYLYSGSG